jgi:2-C-methyl-D-erythritol 4-phosphate cytidylyltransferase
MVAVALLLGAGEGSRLGESVPKALVPVGGRTLLEWTAHALGRCSVIRAILPVVPEGAGAVLAKLRGAWPYSVELLDAVLGGTTRQDSLKCGLRALEEVPDVEWVLVHDAARCFVLPLDVEAVLACAQKTGAGIPVVPVSDTLKEVDDGRVVRTQEAGGLTMAQTPQAFRLNLLQDALREAEHAGFVGTDSASLVERVGTTVHSCRGRTGNWKITWPEDLERAGRLLA